MARARSSGTRPKIASTRRKAFSPGASLSYTVAPNQLSVSFRVNRITAIADDLVQPFEIEPYGMRGRLVRLGPLVDQILKQHVYPPAVGTMLGQSIALAVALSSALKYDGIFTLQTKGDGPIRLLVADVTSAGAVRGYAQYDAERLSRALAEGAAMDSVPRL